MCTVEDYEDCVGSLVPACALNSAASSFREIILLTQILMEDAVLVASIGMVLNVWKKLLYVKIVTKLPLAHYGGGIMIV